MQQQQKPMHIYPTKWNDYNNLRNNNKNNDISHQQTNNNNNKKPCSFQNIFCCPYGLCFTIPLGFAVIAVVFATGASFSCDLFQVEYVNQEQGGIVFGNDVAIFTIGPFTVEDFTLSSNDGILISRDDCVLWSNHETLNDNDMDGWLRISRLFLWLVCVPAYLMTMSLCFGSCMVLGKRCLHCVSCSFISYAIVSPIILVCVVIQQQQQTQARRITFFLLASKTCDFCIRFVCLVSFCFMFFFYKFAYLSEWCQDANDCSAGRSLVGFIVALVFWIGGGIAVCFLHVRKRHDKSNDKKKQKKKQQDVVDDDEDDDNNNNDQMKQQIHVEEPLAPPTTYIVERTIVEDDGTVVKVITETITNSDGSKTVSETREVLFQEEKKKKKKVEEPSPTTNNIEERTVVEEDGTIVKVTTTTITNTDGSKQVMEERKVLQETNNNNNNDVVDTGIIQHDHNNNNDPNNNNTDIHDDGNSSTVFCQPVPNLCGAGW